MSPSRSDKASPSDRECVSKFQEVFGDWPNQDQESLEERACRACVYCSTSSDRSTASGATLWGRRQVESLFYVPLVREGNASLEWDLSMPSERMNAGDVKQFARCSVRA